MNTSPILNNPYEEPGFHYATNKQGEFDYEDVRKGRRIFVPYISAIPMKQGPQRDLVEINDLQRQVSAVKDHYMYGECHFIEIANDIRNIRNQLAAKIGGICNG